MVVAIDPPCVNHRSTERFRRLRLAFAFAFRNLFWALNAPVNAGKRQFGLTVTYILYIIRIRQTVFCLSVGLEAER